MFFPSVRLERCSSVEPLFANVDLSSRIDAFPVAPERALIYFHRVPAFRIRLLQVPQVASKYADIHGRPLLPVPCTWHKHIEVRLSGRVPLAHVFARIGKRREIIAQLAGPRGRALVANSLIVFEP